MRCLVVCLCAALTIYTHAGFAQDISAASVPAKEAGAAVSSLAPEAESQVENWTELNAAKSGLDKSRIKALVLGRSDFPEYTSELVRVEWREGDPIDLYVMRPHGVAKPPVILYLYSFPGDTDRFKVEAWGKSVTKGGFAAVGFVSALTGQRYQMRPMREWFVSELQESLGTSTHDVQMILDYLAGRGDVDAAKVGMLGDGSGGAIAILAATADPRIAFVDANNPWGDWPDWLKGSRVVPESERAAYLKPEFLQKVSVLDPTKYLPHLAPGRIRIEQVAGDAMTPKDVQAKIAASAPSPGNIVQYPDASAQVHVWMTQNWWLKERLRPVPAAPTTAQVNQGLKASEH